MAAPDELSDDVKRFIVTRLACWETPSEVAKAVKEDFGLVVTRQRVEAYDPNKVAGKGLSEEWRALFSEARDLYLADTAAIGIANKTFRLRAYERMFHRAETIGNMGMAKELLETAAKEVGGAFTNRRELSGPDGGAIKTEDTTPAASRDKVLDELRDIFGAAAIPAAPAADGAAPDNAAGDDPVVRGGAVGGGTEEPGAPTAS